MPSLMRDYWVKDRAAARAELIRLMAAWEATGDDSFLEEVPSWLAGYDTATAQVARLTKEADEEETGS